MKRSKARNVLKAKKAAAKAAGMASPGGMSRYALRGVQPARHDPNRRSAWWARGDGLKAMHEMAWQPPTGYRNKQTRKAEYDSVAWYNQHKKENN